jgi:bleomycin hydrolase
MRSLLTMLFIVGIMINSKAQTNSITPQNLEKIRKAYNANDPTTKALTNAISNNDVKNLALNRQNLGTIDHNFKYKADVKGITDQKSSGRCWMFTSMNVLRPLVIEKYKLSGFEFSQNYLYFWDMLEKANLFLEASVKYASKPMEDRYVEWLFKNPIGDGGVWSSFTNLATKYGLVPKEIMPETNSSENTRQLNNVLEYQLRQAGLEIRDMVASKAKRQAIEDKKIEVLGKVYRILALNLGEPPVSFNYRFVDKDKKLGETKEYTPLSFMNEVLGNPDFNQYMMLMNDPTHEYYKMYEIEYDRNVMEGRNWIYLNLPNDSLKQFALKSLIAKKPMYASCDVGQQLNSKLGYNDVDNYDYSSLYGVDFKMDKAQRIRTFESGSSHGMALVAVDADSTGKTFKWQFENSWGATSGNNGYLTFTDDWFNEYMFRVVVLKEFLSAPTIKLLEQKATILPPWDPMFQADE